MFDAFLDALIDTLKLIPFLFLTYLLMEYLEERAEEKSVALVNRAGRLGPVIGGCIGIIPQCGFSAATANLYAGGIITRGTMLAVFLSTSDEMLPILISQKVPFKTVALILAYKAAAGIAAGAAADLIGRRFSRAGKTIHDLCEQEGCHCENGILRSALFHTGKIALFLFITSFALALVVELAGMERLSGLIFNRPVIGEALAGLIGLVPNCAASVVITQLYLQGGMSQGAMLSGLLVGSGVGLLVLFRMNRNLKDNLATLALLYASGVLLGILGGFIPGI